jgi:putative flippase GtrA
MPSDKDAPSMALRIIERLTASTSERAIIIKAASFAMVGVANSTIDLGVFSVGIYTLGQSIVAANAMAWGVAVTGSYAMNAMTTFARESGGRLTLRAYASFALSQAAGLLANTATVFAASFFINVMAGKLLAIAVSFLVNFSLSHLVVFHRTAAHDEHDERPEVPLQSENTSVFVR